MQHAIAEMFQHDILNAVSFYESRSVVGCAAGQCADRAEPTYEEQQAAARKGCVKRGPKRRLQLPAPMPMDTFTGCLRCGMKGSHEDAGACISALRDRLARWE